MIHDQQTRARFERLTDDVVGGPSLEVAIRDGRRTRRRRTARVGVAAAAVTGLGLVAAWQVLPGGTHEVAVDPGPAAAPSYQDFVPGTQVDERIQETAATHYPGLTDATDVFPSDWNHYEKNPPVDFQDATEWQAYYEPTADDHLVVYTSKAVPGDSASYGCDLATGPDAHGCTFDTLADGSTLIQYAGAIGDSPFDHRYTTFLVRADGSVRSTVEHVRADTWAQADQRRVFTYPEARQLVEDPALDFPDPVNPPPPPSQ
jgi:hypothetical protein